MSLKVISIAPDIHIYYIHVYTFLNCLFSSQINKLRLSDSISLSFKMRLTLAPVFVATLCKLNFMHGTRGQKHDDIISRNEMQRQTFSEAILFINPNISLFQRISKY